LSLGIVKIVMFSMYPIPSMSILLDERVYVHMDAPNSKKRRRII
jgi:hypothetical protein